MNIVSKTFIYGSVLATTACAAADKPNVIIIYGDDVGYGDVGYNGSKMIPTPNIDKLAKEGLIFTDGHCPASTCTPSRYSMLTGRYAFRKRVGILPGDAKMCIPTNVMTLPKLFGKAGYTTGVVGKWHLGLGDGVTKINWNKAVKPGPLEIGFDYSFLLPATNDRVPCVYMRNHHIINLDPKDPITVQYGKPLPTQFHDGVPATDYPDGRKDRSSMTYYQSSHGHNNSVINGIGRIGYMTGGKSALWDDETMTDVMVDECKKFIAKNKKKPFFLYYASQDIHVPRAPHPRFKGKSKLGFRGDAMVQFDWAVGEIMKELKKQGISDNTMVIFSSDNGPVYDDGYKDGTTVRTSTKEKDRGHDGSGPYRGGKYQAYEGGTRVPFIVNWPKGIKPGKTDALVSHIDFMASFADLLNVTIPKGEAADSQNVMKALLGKDKVGNEFMLEESRALAIRKGDWKYISGKKPQLFNLSNDIGEQKNLLVKNNKTPKATAVAKELEAKIKEIRQRK